MGRAPKYPGLHDSQGKDLPHRFEEVAGVDTFLYDAGTGPPVLLLHGYGDIAEGWRRVVPKLLPSHRVIALDIPPFGRSEAPNGRIEKMADFYEEFFPELYTRLGIKRATVIGHSLGGAMALRLALDRPKMVDRLGLVAPAGLGTGAPRWWWLVGGNKYVWATLLRPPNPVTPRAIRTGLKFFTSRLLVYDPRHIRHDIAHLVELYANPRNLEDVLAVGRDLITQYSGTLLQESKALKCPVLAVWGRFDRLVPVEQANRFGKAVPGARVEVLERCGHYPQIEHPTRFNHILSDFLSSSKRPAKAARAQSRAA